MTAVPEGRSNSRPEAPTTNRSIRIGKDIVFNDLPSRIVGGFTPAEGAGIGWIAFDYELDGIAGVGLATGALSLAEELVLDLGLSGWHVLHFCHCPTLEIWLDGEKGYRDLPGPQGDTVRDYPLHAADLTGRRLHIRAKRGANPKEVILFYIRAAPCDGPRKNRRNLVATNDGEGVFRDGMESVRDISKWMSPFRDSDFYRIIWGVFAGGDFLANRKSDVATLVPWDPKYYFYSNDITFASSIRKVMRDGNDILQSVVAAARDVNLEIHFYCRMAGFYMPFPHQGSFSSRFYNENPQFHCRDEFGKPVRRISYAFPQVQDHMFAYFDELMDYEPDGLCLAFNRGLPLMVCEEPVLAEFRRRYGRAPRLPEEVDCPEMLAVRQEMLADFVARLQRRLAQRGKALSCIVPRNFEENRRRGLDVHTLVERGLFESVMVGAGHEDAPLFTSRYHQPPVNQDDLKPIQQLKAFGTAKVYLGGAPGYTGNFWPPEDPMTRARRMAAILDAGLDGGYFWDANALFNRGWEDIRQYGDRQHLDDILHQRVPPPLWRDTKRIQGLTVDRYSPWNAW